MEDADGEGGGELKRKFPVLFRTGADKSEFERLFPSLSILIQEAAESNFPNDRIKYCHDSRLSKVCTFQRYFQGLLKQKTSQNCLSSTIQSRDRDCFWSRTSVAAVLIYLTVPEFRECFRCSTFV